MSSVPQMLLTTRFSTSYEEVVPTERLVYGDYLVPGADPKVKPRGTVRAEIAHKIV